MYVATGSTQPTAVAVARAFSRVAGPGQCSLQDYSLELSPTRIACQLAEWSTRRLVELNTCHCRGCQLLHDHKVHKPEFAITVWKWMSAQCWLLNFLLILARWRQYRQPWC